ncbi:MAG: serine hydrolase [Cyclobacteriaceae bacterium]
MIKHITNLLIVFLATISVSVAQQNVLSQDVKKNLQLRIDNGINTGIVVGVVTSDGITYYGFGVKSLETNEPVDENSVFEIGSISKAFTGIILADQVLNGEVKLDDPLQQYLPDGITAPTRNEVSIQLVHLSNHTSSLPRLPTNMNPGDAANPYADYTEEMMYAFLDSHELTRDIGSQYEYSNYAAGLLGNVLAKNQDLSYEELMIKTIAKPLGMKNTRITLSSSMKEDLAMGHSGGVEVANWDLPALAGAGAIRSNTIDMIRFIQANMGAKKSKLYPAMQLSHKNSRDEGENPIVGLGWHTSVFGDNSIIWHNGGTGGYRTFAGFTKDGKKGVVVLSNSNASVDDIGVHLLNPESPLTVIKPSIGRKLRGIFEAEGIEAGVAAYWKLKKDQPDEFDFEEVELNTLGYYYLGKEQLEEAIAVFNLNAEAYPESSNVFDSRGEAYKKQGNKEKAIEDYKKSVKLNPGNQNAIDVLKEMGVDQKDVVEEIVIADAVLAGYVGKYELVPGFIVTITKDGSQMKAQATGQPQFPIFPKSENVFYFKVVEAQLTFNSSEEGVTESVTLHQGGQVITGKKMEE